MNEFTKGIVFTLVTVTTGIGLYKLGETVGRRSKNSYLAAMIKELQNDLESESESK